jgi:hypothetical protein
MENTAIRSTGKRNYSFPCAPDYFLEQICRATEHDAAANDAVWNVFF